MADVDGASPVHVRIEYKDDTQTNEEGVPSGLYCVPRKHLKWANMAFMLALVCGIAIASSVLTFMANKSNEDGAQHGSGKICPEGQEFVSTEMFTGCAPGEDSQKDRAVMSPNSSSSSTTATDHPLLRPLDLRTGGRYTVFAQAAATFGAAITSYGDVAVMFGAATIGATIINGQYQFHNMRAADALTDISLAREDAAGRQMSNGPAFMIAGGTLSGMNLRPGVYDTVGAVAMAASTLVMFDAMGDPDAVWIIRINGAFTLGASVEMRVVGGGCPGNIFFVAKGAITFGASSTTIGTSLALGAATTGADVVTGPMLSTNGAVTIGAGSTIVSYCRSGNQSHVSKHCIMVDGCVTTTQVPTTQVPTTQEPTTREPTTREPTTREPTTREPTTREPTLYPTERATCVALCGDEIEPCPSGTVCSTETSGGPRTCTARDYCPHEFRDANSGELFSSFSGVVDPGGGTSYEFSVQGGTSLTFSVLTQPDVLEHEDLWVQARLSYYARSPTISCIAEQSVMGLMRSGRKEDSRWCLTGESVVDYRIDNEAQPTEHYETLRDCVTCPAPDSITLDFYDHVSQEVRDLLSDTRVTVTLSIMSMGYSEVELGVTAMKLCHSPQNTPVPITATPTTLEPTTLEPTTLEPTTLEPTTLAPTTRAPTTRAPTTRAPTTREPTTRAPTTREPTTREPTVGLVIIDPGEPTTSAPAETPMGPGDLYPDDLGPDDLSPTERAPCVALCGDEIEPCPSGTVCSTETSGGPRMCIARNYCPQVFTEQGSETPVSSFFSVLERMNLGSFRFKVQGGTSMMLSLLAYQNSMWDAVFMTVGFSYRIENDDIYCETDQVLSATIQYGRIGTEQRCLDSETGVRLAIGDDLQPVKYYEASRDCVTCPGPDSVVLDFYDHAPQQVRDLLKETTVTVTISLRTTGPEVQFRVTAMQLCPDSL
jgi:hypothetical protein